MRIILIITFLACACTTLKSFDFKTFLPGNSTCENAIEIFPKDSTQLNEWEYTKSPKTISELYNECAPNGPHYNSWFKFTASQERLILHFNNVSAQFEIYDGSDCDALFLNDCGADFLDKVDFNVGETYYLRVIEFRSDYNSSFRIVLPQALPNNASCETAIAIEEDEIIDVNLKGADKNGVWYTFEAQSKSHQIEFFNTVIFNQFSYRFLNLQLDLFENSCADTIHRLGYDVQRLFYTMNNLVEGEIYTIRLRSNHVIENANLQIQITPLPILENDLCRNAQEIDLSGESRLEIIPISEGYASNSSSINIPSCYPFENNWSTDLWYKFIAYDSSYILLRYGALNSNNYITVYENNCNSQAYIACSRNEIILNDLKFGDSYLIRVSNHGGNIQISKPSRNNFCDERIPLVVGPNATFAPAIFVSAQQATITDSFCTGTNNADTWFTFTPNTSEIAAHVRFFSNSSSTQLSLFKGDCNELEFVKCVDSEFGNSSFFILNNLVPSENYILKVSSNDSYFSILLKERSNTTFETSMEIIPSNSDSIKQNIITSEGFSRFYFFEAKNPTYNFHYHSSIQDSSFFHYDDRDSYELFERLDDGSFHSIFSSRDKQIISGFEIGKKYYIEITDTSFDQEIFLYITENFDTRPNDLGSAPKQIDNESLISCDSIIRIDPLSSSINLNSNAFKGCFSELVADQFFKFQAPSLPLTIKELGTSVTIVYEIYEYPDSLACDYQKIIPLPFKTLISNLEEGKEYILRVQNSLYERSAFCLEVIANNNNDSLKNSIPLIINEPLERTHYISYFDGINTVSPDTIFENSCSSFEKKDIWFHFNAVDSHLVFFMQSRSSVDTEIELYTAAANGISCVNSYQLEYHNWFSDNRYLVPITILSDLDLNTDYFIRINDRETSRSYETKVGLAKIPSSTNNTFENAINILPSNTLQECNPLNFNFNKNDQQVWFKFIANGTNQQVQLSNFSDHVDQQELNIKIFTSLHDSCHEIIYNSESVFIRDQISLDGNLMDGVMNLHNIFGLEAGEEFFISIELETGISEQQIYEFYQDIIPFSFDLCIKKMPEFPVNNDYQNAIPLMTQNDLIPINGDATRATKSLFDIIPDCIDSSATFNMKNVKPEVWYSFQALDDKQTIRINSKAKLPYPFNQDSVVQIYYDIYALNEMGSPQILECGLTDDFTILENLIPAETYLIKVYFQSISYITNLNFDIAVGSGTVNTSQVLSQTDIQLFPNPTEALMNINSSIGIKQFEIYNMDGRRIQKQQLDESRFEYKIDLADFTSGIYLIKLLTDDDQLITKKIITH